MSTRSDIQAALSAALRKGEKENRRLFRRLDHEQYEEPEFTPQINMTRAIEGTRVNKNTIRFRPSMAEAIPA